MKRFLTLALLPCLVIVTSSAPAADTDPKATKEALQSLNDFVGSWNGDGKVGSKSWAENLEWGWNFKSPEPKMALKFKDSKYFKSGELRYDADKKDFELTLIDLKDNKKVFEGKLDKETFILERVDADTKATERFKLNAIDSGARIAASFDRKLDGKKAFTKEFEVSYSNALVSFAPGAKKPECIVSGGLGNGTVSYKGQTYYICCSGCRDAFNENPEKYIKEWEAKKGKK
jgi:hypothetical protein